MSAEKIIRHQSREKLKTNGYVKPLFALALVLTFCLLLEVIISTFASIVGLLTLYTNIDKTLIETISGSAILILICALALLFSPIVLGYFKMIANEKYELSDAIYFFSSKKLYTKAVLFSLSFVARMIIPTILFFIPLFIMIVVGESTKGLSSDFVFIIGKNTLVIITVLALFIYSVKYFLAFRLFCNDTSAKVNTHFYNSKMMMTGHGMNVSKLLLSFTPWLLLCITVLPALYVIPYITQAMSICGKWIFEISRNGYDYEIL